MKNLSLNYQTKIDKKLNTVWHERSLPKEQLADTYKAFRLAYENAKLYSQADYYYLQESISNRKYIVWQKLISRVNFRNCYDWALNIIWSITTGYGSKPFRILLLGFFISVFYALIYLFFGLPDNQEVPHPVLTSFYLSFTTYSTLGYGDITYLHHRPWMRLITTSEAWVGAVMIALFIVVLSRKLLRR